MRGIGGVDLGDAFTRAATVALHTAFIAAAGPQRQTAAEAALKQFHRAANALKASEKTVTREGERLLTYLRSPAQMKAVRDFAQARQALLDIDPRTARSLERLTLEGVDIRPRAANAPVAPGL